MMFIGKFYFVLVITALSIICYFYYVCQISTDVNSIQHKRIGPVKYSKEMNISAEGHNIQEASTERMVLAMVCCGDRLVQTLNVIKSALIYTKSSLMFIIFADDALINMFSEKLLEWQQKLNGSFTFDVRKLSFPKQDENVWRKLFRPCASQRLFLPLLLPHIDSLIYVDTDTLLMGQLNDIWKYFKLFNSSQMAALTNEHEDASISWYQRFARHPYYGKFGVNSGVMLMNLTRMRSFNWESYVVPILKQWKLTLAWGDQDIINIVFHYHPEKLYLLPCRFNYRPDNCMYMSNCKSGDSDGAAVLHANRDSFYKNKQPAFQAVHQAVDEYQIGSDPATTFLPSLVKYFKTAPQSNCGTLQKVFLKVPLDTFNRSLSNR